MITPEMRTSFAHVFEAKETPSGDLKFSCCLMLPKDDKKGLETLNAGIKAAVQQGIEKNKFPKSAVKALRLPIRDGDEEHDSGARGPEFKGFWFINASTTRQPGVVDDKLAPIMSRDDFYSGCWCRADINFFPYNTAGNKGIGVGLNNVMKVKDDERLDGRMKAEEAFASFAKAEDEGDSMAEFM